MSKPAPYVDATRLQVGLYKAHATRGFQVALAALDDDGTGHSYRVLGGKHYNMGTTVVLEKDLDADDAAAIRAMLDAVHPVTPQTAPAAHENQAGYRTPEEILQGLFEETGLGDSLIPVYTAALLALADRRAAARLRAAGHTAAAALLEPDPAVIDEAFGPEDH
jgi:hypothetical protein